MMLRSRFKQRFSKYALAAILSVAWGSAMVPAAGAGTSIWSGGGGGANNWSDLNNWSGGVIPGSNDDVAFNGSNALTQLTSLLNTAYAIQSLTFNNGSSAKAFTISAGGANNVLSIGFGGIVNNTTLTQTIDAPVTLTSSATFSAVAGGTLYLSGKSTNGNNAVSMGGNTLAIDGAGNVTIASPLTGTGGSLFKIGTGTLTLTGAGSSLTGNIYFNSGTTLIQGVNGLNYASLTTSAPSYIASNSGSSATVTVNGTNGSGIASSLNVGGDLVVGVSDTGTLNITNGGRVNSGIGVVGLSSNGTANVSGTDGNGVASTWNTNNNYIYVGYFATGTLNITDGGKVLTGSNTTFLSSLSGSSSTLNINGGSFTTNAISVGNGNTPTIRLTNPTAGNGGGYALNIGGNNGSSTIGAAITDAAGGAGGINKTGAGTLTLTGANTFTGGMRVSGGTLVLNAPIGTGSNNFGGALQSDIVVTGAGSTLQVNATDQTSNLSTLSVSNGGAVNIKNGHTSFAGVTLGGNATIYGATTDARGLLLYNNAPLTVTGTGNLISAPLGLSGNNTVTVTGASDVLTISGTVSNDGHLIKAGAGTLRVTNASTYSGGMSINAGTVVANGTALGTGAVSVSSGGTLAVGQEANTTGTPLAGYKTLELSSLTLSGASGNTTPLLTFNLGTVGSLDGSTNDLLQFSGSANSFVFASSEQYLVGFASGDGNPLPNDQTYKLMSFATPIALGSAIVFDPNSQLAAMGTGNQGSITNGSFSWIVDSGNITGLGLTMNAMSVVPEPSSGLLALVAIAPALIAWKGRRRQK